MITLDIESLAYGGDGIARMPDGRTAFVTGVCPGDRVAVSVTEDHPRFVRAAVEQLLEPSPDRVEAPCPYFGACGGCTWQHVAYPVQLAAKRAAVVDALTRIGRIENAESLVADTVPSKRQYGYRNKIELVPKPDAQRLTLGYHRARSAEVLPIELCLLLPKKYQKAPKALTGALRYLQGDAQLGIERVQLRVSHHTTDAEVALWTPPGGFPRPAAAKLLGQALPLTSLVRVLFKGPIKKRAVSKVEVLSGRGHWRERLLDWEYVISAPSFFQVNTPGAEELVRLVSAGLEPDGTDRALDLFSGAGTFTMALTEAAMDVAAVESSGSAVRDLRRNLEDNQLWADVVGGDVTREIESLGHFDVAVVDPPRAGLDRHVIESLGKAQPRTLAYVSCDPATLARDTARLSDAGMILTKATPVDLFPQTYHVETVALFEPGAPTR